jgi:hypothetical protein
MKNFDYQDKDKDKDRKTSRRKQLEDKKNKIKKDLPEDIYGKHKLQKEFKHKKHELRAEELWEDWEQEYR